MKMIPFPERGDPVKVNDGRRRRQQVDYRESESPIFCDDYEDWQVVLHPTGSTTHVVWDSKAKHWVENHEKPLK